ncbi:MAG: zinc metallopeptidase [Pseudohongiella sp.]|uniref:zinc metallopeptidase n=1 Tax=Pseudohongiella sp. TaxID=1979412 RepID=UPI0034A0875F
MILLVMGGLLAALAFLPQIWVRYVMKKHHRQDPAMAGTGGELAEHLVSRFRLEGIVVEQTEEGRDHFDPGAKAVRLSPSNYEGRSLTAVAVAAHEVGHAIQFHRNEAIFELRKKYIPMASKFSKFGVALMMSVPVAALVLRSPVAVGTVIALSVIMQLLGALAYLIVLPEEWDASFNKALPILVDGEYISPQQYSGVRQVLKAAALTYFAGALANILNIGRWLMVLRR